MGHHKESLDVLAIKAAREKETFCSGKTRWQSSLRSRDDSSLPVRLRSQTASPVVPPLGAHFSSGSRDVSRSQAQSLVFFCVVVV